MQNIENRMATDRERRACNAAAGLSRDFVVRSVLKLFDEAQARQQWGAITVIFQNGTFKTIKKEETITEEK